METLFTVEIAKVNGQYEVATYERTDIDTARSAYHQFMASKMATPKCTEAMCMGITSEGGIFIPPDCWKKAET